MMQFHIKHSHNCKSILIFMHMHFHKILLGKLPTIITSEENILLEVSKFLNSSINVSVVQQNLPCKIYISMAFVFTKKLLNIDMNVSIAQKKPPCKICINVAFKFYKIAFKYKDECNDC